VYNQSGWGTGLLVTRQEENVGVVDNGKITRKVGFNP